MKYIHRLMALLTALWVVIFIFAEIAILSVGGDNALLGDAEIEQRAKANIVGCYEPADAIFDFFRTALVLRMQIGLDASYGE